MKSLKDKMSEAYRLALDLGYGTRSPLGDGMSWREGIGEIEDTVSSWADGLVHKYYNNVSSGRCSLKAMIDFDIEKFEESVDLDIQKMRNRLAEVGPAKMLTFSEMRDMGYRGEWAGMDENGEVVNR